MARQKTKKIRYDSCGRVLNKGETQRTDGRYMYQVAVGNNGKRITIYADTLTKLREGEEELQKDIRDGIKVLDGSVTINQYFDYLMDGRKDIKHSTYCLYIRTYNRYIRASLGTKKLSEVRSATIELYYESLIEKGMAANTLATIHTLISTVLKQAARHDIIRRDYSEGICNEVCRKYGMSAAVRKPLSESSLQRFFEFAKRTDTYTNYIPVLQVMLLTGCRIGEVLGITVDDIDYTNNRIHINKELTYIPMVDGEKGHLAVTLPKTKAGVRYVPMVDDTKTAIRQALKFRLSCGGCKSNIDGVKNFLFVSKCGTVLWTTNVNATIRRWVKAYNQEETQNAISEDREPELIPDFSCHSLRHTFTARMCEADINPKLIQIMLGHKDIATTMNVYADYREDKQNEQFVGLNEVIRLA